MTQTASKPLPINCAIGTCVKRIKKVVYFSEQGINLFKTISFPTVLAAQNYVKLLTKKKEYAKSW